MPIHNSSNWSPDGRHLTYDAFEPTGDEHIATVDPEGDHTRQLTQGPGINEFPAYSPDGSHIVYSYSPQLPDAPGFHETLWIMNADGSGQRPLPGASQSADAFDVEAKYSPDGRFLAFVRIRFDQAGNQQNALFLLRGTRERRLTDWRESVETPDWSPDGRWITYYNHVDDGGIRSILVIRRNGSHEHVIYQGHPAAEGARPVFSPDGKKILFLRQTAKAGNSIWTMDVDGKNAKEIVKEVDLASPNGACWSPDGKQLAVSLFNWELDENGKRMRRAGSDTANPRIELMNADGTNRRELKLQGATIVFLGSLGDWR